VKGISFLVFYFLFAMPLEYIGRNFQEFVNMLVGAHGILFVALVGSTYGSPTF